MEISLSDGEWKLMRLLWKRSPLTIADMVESLRGDTGWSKNTIFVMLDRLEHKGAVASDEGRSPKGRAVRFYRPLVEKTPAAAKETETFLERVWDGSLAMLVSSLVGEKKLDENEIEELRKIIDEAENGERK